MFAQAMKPPLSTIFGLAPKKAGSQRTRSATLAGSIDPTTSAMPAVRHGLSSPWRGSATPGSCRCRRRLQRGPRPSSWRRLSGALAKRFADAALGLRVAADHRDRPCRAARFRRRWFRPDPAFGEATSEDLGLRLWQTMIMSNNSATEFDPHGSVRFVRLRQTICSGRPP